MSSDEEVPNYGINEDLLLPLSPGVLLCLLEWVDNSGGEYSPVCGICNESSDEARLIDGIHRPNCSLDHELNELGMDRHVREKVRQSFREVLHRMSLVEPILGRAVRKAKRDEEEASARTPAKPG